MALITDYDSLASEVKAWCARSDTTFSNRMEMFVAASEDRMYNGHGATGDPLFTEPIRADVMETSATVTLTNASGALPADACAVRFLSRDGETLGLTYKAPVEFREYQGLGAAGGVPLYYTIEASTLKVTPAYDGDLDCVYYKRFAAVTFSNKMSTLLTAYPLLYFNSCLFEAFSFMQEPELAMACLARYRAYASSVNNKSTAIRIPGARMRVQPRTPVP